VDDSIFAVCAEQIKRLPPEFFTVADIGKLFLGTPYVAGALDRDSTKEQLVIDLHEFDCVTFYENSLALWIDAQGNGFDGSTFHAPSADKNGFNGILHQLRYRGGIMNRYHSRLHYTTDYFFDNEDTHRPHGNTFLKEETRAIGGAFVKQDHRMINFMSQHRSSYKQIAHNDAEFNAIVKVENRMHARNNFWYIPKGDVEKIESKIQSGDILGITTNIDGLDCSHTGIAIKMPDGRIHFLHASSLAGKVIISEEPLAEYLTHSSHQTGIIVARPQVFLD